jgi:hypothetical protein
MLKTGGSALAPQRFAVVEIVGAVEPDLPQVLSKEARSDCAIIAPARQRTLILVKVPYGTNFLSVELGPLRCNAAIKTLVST